MFNLLHSDRRYSRTKSELVGGFVQMVAEGEINRALDTRRQEKEIQSLMGVNFAIAN